MSWRIPLIALIWCQPWLALQWLTPELPLPFPLGQHLLWSRTTASLVVPAVISLAAYAGELAGARRTVVATLAAGALVQSMYLWHQLPPPHIQDVVERWAAAVTASSALVRALAVWPEGAAPFIEMAAVAAVGMAFAAPASWALALSAGAFAAAFARSPRRIG